MPRAVIFDWDNTLVDSWATIHAALVVMFTAMGHTPWTLEETKDRVRHSLRDAFPALFGDRWQEARDIYLTTFESIHLDRLSPLPGAGDLIETLLKNQVYLAIVSNKTGRLLRREVTALGWQGYFAQIVGAGDAERDKPDRAPVDLALAGSGIIPDETVWFVGDTGIDLACAHRVGCYPVLISDVGHNPVDPDYGQYYPRLLVPDCATLMGHLTNLP